MKNLKKEMFEVLTNEAVESKNPNILRDAIKRAEFDQKKYPHPEREEIIKILKEGLNTLLSMANIFILIYVTAIIV